MNSCVAIITARGGSKRIPRKNIRDFNGKPIMAYSITAALKSGLYEEVMVSTDDMEIADVARQYGASVPFMRSAATSDDMSHTAHVLLEVLADYKKLGREFKYTSCIYPTAPFVTAEKLQRAWKLLIDTKADCVFPVSEFSFPIMRSLKRDQDGRMSSNWPEYYTTRSQDLPPAYHDCGQFYFLNTEAFLATGVVMSKNNVGMITSPLEMQDIDNEDDWRLAELKYTFMKNK